MLGSPIPASSRTMQTTNIPIPDPEYSFEVVVFEVGDRTFRVPRHGFDIPGTNFPLSLSRDEHTPHVLDVDEGRFRSLLRVMFPFVGCQSLTTNDWLNALDLATEWKLIEVRNRAISALDSWVENQPAKEVVLLGKKYFNLRWLKEAYLRLVQQEALTTRELVSPPSLDWETIGRLLGANSTASINTVYQDIQGYCSLCSNSACDCQGLILRSNIEHEFKEEFETIAKDWPQMTDDKPSLGLLPLDDPTETDSPLICLPNNDGWRSL